MIIRLGTYRQRKHWSKPGFNRFATSVFTFWSQFLHLAWPGKRPRKLVALATSAGIPIIIMAGRVSIEPPPARVLMKPDTTPTTTSISIIINDSSNSTAAQSARLFGYGCAKKCGILAMKGSKVMVSLYFGACNHLPRGYYGSPMNMQFNQRFSKPVTGAVSVKEANWWQGYYFFGES